MNPSAPRTVGQLGEFVAAEFLSRRGLRIRERNRFVGGDEIDLIASSGTQLIAIEVKCSTNNDDPLLAYDDEKHERVWRAITGHPWVIHRLDVVAVSIANQMVRIRWLQNV
ncbi:MAG: YraN family protein [Acidimicrobiia bacterium]